MLPQKTGMQFPANTHKPLLRLGYTQEPFALQPPPGAASLQRPLRICLLGYRAAPWVGGQGIYLRQLSRALVAAGHEVDIVAGEPYPEISDGVRLVKMPGMNLYENSLGSLRGRHLREWSNIVEWCSKLSGGFAEPYTFCRRVAHWLPRSGRRYDIIHDNQSLGWGLLQLQRSGYPVLATIHHPITRDLEIALSEARNYQHRWLIRRWYSFLSMQKQVARQLHAIVTVSRSARRDVALDFGLSEERIALAYNGIDTEAYAPLPQVARQPMRLLAVASADQPLKGLPYLLHALAQLAPSFPQLKLHVVGRLRADGPTAQLLRELRLEDKVEVFGQQTAAQMAHHYASATMAIVPSLYEGFGFPAGEAMACGTPVISSRAGALPEVTGDAALLVPPADSPALAAAIAELLAAPARRRRMGVVGHQRIQRHFTWEQTVRSMEGCYRNLLMARTTGGDDSHTEMASGDALRPAKLAIE